MSPVVPPDAVPATVCEVIVRGPSLIPAQFGPRAPLARLKSSVPVVPVELLQDTATLVTLAERSCRRRW